MRKPLWGLMTACIITIVFGVLGYLGLVVYYMDEFAVNTWINGVYCTGSSVQEVNVQLIERTDIYPSLTVIGYDQTGKDCKEVTWTISMEDLQFSVDYGAGLNSYLAMQRPWHWVDNLAYQQNNILEPSVNFDEVFLLEEVERIVSGSRADEDYRLEYIETEGYVLYDGMHNRVDEQKVFDAVKNAVISRQESVNLIECGCYYDAPLDDEQKADEALWEKLNQYQNSGPFYDFGAGKTRIERAYMASFLEKNSATKMPVIDENNCFMVRKDGAQEWVAAIAQKYDTYGKVWEFESTRGEVVNVEGKTYGSTIDQEREALWLDEYLYALVQGKIGSESGDAIGSEGSPRVPEYTRKAYNGTDQLGDTYIEVDMGAQKLYYYQDGELLVETDVVTGNARRRWNTPEGVNYVYNKQKNRILRGEGYATPVDYWMPVNGAIGIHDADWRDEFGGEIYKTNGSHGCVNVPKEIMPQLYELVEIGTPVVMFYGTDPYETEGSN